MRVILTIGWADHQRPADHPGHDLRRGLGQNHGKRGGGGLLTTRKGGGRAAPRRQPRAANEVAAAAALQQTQRAAEKEQAAALSPAKCAADIAGSVAETATGRRQKCADFAARTRRQPAWCAAAPHLKRGHHVHAFDLDLHTSPRKTPTQLSNKTHRFRTHSVCAKHMRGGRGMSSWVTRGAAARALYRHTSLQTAGTADSQGGVLKREGRGSRTDEAATASRALRSATKRERK